MRESAGDERQVIRQLLGQLTPEENTALLHRRTEDPHFDEWCLAVEEELIDHYLHKRLTVDQLKLFELEYLTKPANAEKVAFARALQRSLARSSSRRRLGILAVAAATVVALTGGMALVRKSTHPTLSFVLFPGAVRGPEGVQQLEITENASIRLRLGGVQLSAPGAALIQRIGSSVVVFSDSVAQATSGIPEVLVPPGVLHDGDYILVLKSGQKTVASFSFGVNRR